jgi:hypothetical protein
MTSAAKRKGDAAEREAAALLSDLLGFKVERKLGAGRAEDTGDLYGLPDTVVQAAWWPSRGVLRAVREKPIECEQQQDNAGATFGFSMIRMVGGVWRAVLTPEQMATYVREAS